MAAEMEPSLSAPAPSSPSRDPRVRCRSRRWTAELLDHCKPYVRRLGTGQPLEAESLERLLGEALWNFETAVQENITINGLSWQESSDDHQTDTDLKLLEDQLDELIVEVASKRNQCPRKIQVHVINAIKMRRKMLVLIGLKSWKRPWRSSSPIPCPQQESTFTTSLTDDNDCYQPMVNPQEIKANPSQSSHMADLRLSTETAAREIGESFKCISSLKEKSEGFSKVLSLHPTLELCKLHQEIFSGSEAAEENEIKVKNFMEQVEVTVPETATSNSVVLKIKRPLCSPQIQYPLQQRKIGLDT